MADFNLSSIKSPVNFPSVLLMFGQDTFSMDEELQNIVKFLTTVEDGEVDCDMLYGEDINSSVLTFTCDQMSMLSDYKVVIVRRFQKIFAGKKKKTGDNDDFLAYLNNVNPTTKLILVVDEKIDLKTSPYNIITKTFPFVEFPEIKYENQLLSWLTKRFARFGKKIDTRTAQLILSQTNNDLYTLAGEVDKIVLYYNDTENISGDMVLRVMGMTKQNSVFDLNNAILERNLNRAISILLNILATDSKEVMLIAILRDLFLKMWKFLELKETETDRTKLAQKIGVNAYFLKDYELGAKKYTEEEISNAILLLRDTDFRLKDTNYNSKLIMEEMLVAIVGN